MTISAMSTREQVVDTLARQRAEIRRFGVTSLRLFGSTARGTPTEESDIDLLVTFEGRATFDAYMGLKLLLEDLLGRKVDLATSRALKPSLRARIAADLIDVVVSNKVPALGTAVGKMRPSSPS
jgi:predicted nucleotidyltransferase